MATNNKIAQTIIKKFCKESSFELENYVEVMIYRTMDLFPDANEETIEKIIVPRIRTSKYASLLW